MNARHAKRLILSLFTLLLVGCTLPASQQPAIPLSALPQSPVIPITDTPDPSNEEPIQTPVSTITQSATNENTCLSISTGVELAPTSFEDAPGAIRVFLNAGGDPARLDSLLYARNQLAQPIGSVVDDITGDGQTDVLVNLVNPQSQELLPAHVLVIYTCQDGEMVESLRYRSRMAFSLTVQGVRDLDADGSLEVLVLESTCGAHTCFDKVWIWGWDGVQFLNRMGADTEGLPYAELSLIQTPDGTYDILITASGFGSVGAGPQRNTIVRYSLDSGGVWRQTSVEFGESNYRIHVLHDALMAYQSGDFETALQYYQQTISDATLEDWMDANAEQTISAAFARFQQIVIFTERGQTSFAQTVLKELEQTAQDEITQAYLALANDYIQQAATSDPSQACQAVLTAAESIQAILFDGLGGFAFGYANRDFSPADLCQP